MKKIIDDIKSNGRQIFEIIILAFITVLPLFLDLSEIFKEYLEENPISPDNFLMNLAVRKGNYIASLIFIGVTLYFLRRINDGYTMNQKYIYHDYPYAWYWICAKVLSIKKCNLVLVPIHMQFKLVIRATFDDYPLEESDYPPDDYEMDCQIQEKNSSMSDNEINLLLEDTYKLGLRQLPKSKQGLKTIKISRNNGVDMSRHFSQKFIDTVINQVRSLSGGTVINVYATTNPMNTKHLASSAFGLGDRGNIAHLYVFQQSKNGIRRFEEKGYRIY